MLDQRRKRWASLSGVSLSVSLYFCMFVYLAVHLSVGVLLKRDCLFGFYLNVLELGVRVHNKMPSSKMAQAHICHPIEKNV